MTIFLGLDGGGTGCRARAVDSSGRVIGEGHGGPANVMSDLDGALASILSATAEALGDSDRAEVSACLGLAGAIQAGTISHLSRRLPFLRCQIVTDWHIAAKGALGEADGIVASIGTGSVYVEQRDGRLRAIGGRGLVLGDEGGGAWIGRALLSASLRAIDGFGPITPLLRATIEAMGGPEGIIAFATSAGPADFAALAPSVTTSDDIAACMIMDEARHHVLAAIGLLQRPGLLPVVCLGGLAHAFSAAIAEAWPMAVAKGSALDGAIAMARASR